MRNKKCSNVSLHNGMQWHDEKELGTNSSPLRHIKTPRNNTALTLTNQAPVQSVAAGAQGLKNVRHERYARSRTLLASRVDAMRESGLDGNPEDLRRNAQRIDNRSYVQARIAYLKRQDDASFQAKLRKLEEFRWLAHDHNLADLFEVAERPKVDRAGNPVLDAECNPVMERYQRAKFLEELPEEVQCVVEAMDVTKSGELVPRTYSKLQANREMSNHVGCGPRTTPTV